MGRHPGWDAAPDERSSRPGWRTNGVPARTPGAALPLARALPCRYRLDHSVTYRSLVPYGWTDRWAALLAALADAGTLGAPPASAPAGEALPPLVPGRVVRHDGMAVILAMPEGTRTVVLSRRLDPAPTVGDWVAVAGDVPVAVLPRTSLLTRRSAATDAPQNLAANVDAVLVVCGLDRPVKAGRLDRVITMARDAGAVPIVVLAKADMAADAGEQAGQVADSHPGVEVMTTSVVTGTGLDHLHALVRDRTVVLVGESGAGKSSLTNALVGDEVMAIGDVRAGDAKGRHTTSTREAHLLPGGGVLIDTPGLRAVGLWADVDAVAAAFSDVDDLAAGCRFNDCRHDGEPGCAVHAAVADGTLAADRFAGWQRLEREAAAAELRAAPHLQRAHDRRFGRVVKEAQRRKGREDDD
jgi:ribosome biogenesis GTPase / thiamine phosphate phosphatase